MLMLVLLVIKIYGSVRRKGSFSLNMQLKRLVLKRRGYVFRHRNLLLLFVSTHIYKVSPILWLLVDTDLLMRFL